MQNQKRITSLDFINISELFIPETLEMGLKVLEVEDYIIDSSLLISVKPSAFIQASTDENKKRIQLAYRFDELPHLSNIIFTTKVGTFCLVLKKSVKRLYKFSFPIQNNYQKIFIAGDFNNWNASSDELFLNKNNIWEADLLINPGSYQYQLVIDGKWSLDASNPKSVANNLGGINSLLDCNWQDFSKLPEIRTESFQDNIIRIRHFNEIKQCLVLIDNFLLPNNSIVINDSYIEIQIPKEFSRFKRNNLRVYCANSEGLSNEVLIPLEYGKVILDSKLINRHDHHSKSIYFIMVDRFSKSENAKQNNIKHIEAPEKTNFNGGNLVGIIDKLNNNYFYELGINTLWITPLFKAAEKAHHEYSPPHRLHTGYHGYWPIDSYKIDEHFGNDEDLIKLSNLLHENSMNLILDFVSNHVHEDHPIIKSYPEWKTILELPDGRKNVHLWDEHRLTTWFDVFLPTLDYSNKNAIEFMLKVAMYWLNTFDLDGFRHDATKHVPLNFWRALTKEIRINRIKNNKEDKIFQIGETFGSRELISSFINTGLQDSQFEFNLYYAARSAFALKNSSFIDLKNAMLDSYQQFGYHSLMGNISGNHDMPRFISIAGEAVYLNENPIEAGWNRNIDAGNPHSYRKLASLHIFNFTIPGIPVIFYGDEIGLPGAGDPDNRRLMKFDNLTTNEKFVKKIVTKISKLRNNSMALQYGDIDFLLCNKEIFVYGRQYFNEKAIIAFNNTGVDKKINIKLPSEYQGVYKSLFGSELIIGKSSVSICVKAYFSVVLIGIKK